MVSSASLFHFTKFDRLVQILEGKSFHAYYSIENPLFIRRDKPVAMRMVCFCDIKLTQSAAHWMKYGGNGIGLKKAWGTRNTVNPVLYVDEHSPLSAALHNLNRFFMRKVVKNNGKMAVSFTPEESKAYNEYQKLIAHTKLRCHKHWNATTNSFSGRLLDYYQEREWRYIPPVDPPQDSLQYLTFYPIYHEKDPSSFVRELNLRYPPDILKFEYKDVTHLAVRGKAERRKLVSVIKGLSTSESMREHLISSINLLSDIGKNV